ncbi:MAG: vanadium-dependent haloperoxidase [Chloroflexota bacterium]|nr:vanadium-dependent haloperoxidase [Chloroflexota bacterium]
MIHPISPATTRSPRRVAIALLLILSLVSAAPAAAANPPGAADAGVITDWNAVAVTAIPGNPAAFLNYAIVHLAMYNAVVGITGEYELYQWDVRGPAKASPEAAAAAAAHRVLMTYFGHTHAATIDAQLVASLGNVPDGVREQQGIRYGLEAADHIIALRTGDGRGAAVTVPVGDAAGEWNPIPPQTGMAVPWLGGVTPLAVDSLTLFDPGAPPAIGSALYRAELAEVRAVGAFRTDPADETIGTANYFAGIPFGPMEVGLRKFVTDQGYDISDSARLMAATNTSIADAIGTAWNAKLRYMWWRPLQAIREVMDDGDPLTTGDAAWTSLLPAPPYPEWPSGLCSVVGAISTSLQRLTGDVDLTMVAPSGDSRHWTDKGELDRAAVNARVWSGIHFRSSDQKAIEIGTSVTNYVLDRYFAPND